MKKVLLGLGNEKFNLIVREALSPYFEVIKEEVLSHKYLQEFIQEQNPDIIILHDYYLASEKHEPFEKELEWLQTIEYIRRAYDDSKRVVFVCERKQGDPFLSELVNRNILDIFHSRNLDIQTMIEQLQDQPRYSKVAYLKVEDSSKRYNQLVYEQFSSENITDSSKQNDTLPEETLPLKAEEELSKGKGFPKINIPKLSLPTISIKKEEHTEEESTEPKPKKERMKREPRVKKELKPVEQPTQDFYEAPLEEVVEPKEKSKKSLFGGFFGGNGEKDIISTVRPRLIAVGSITPGAGSTFFLHNFTRYISDKGVSSGILEAINDMDALLALCLSESPPEHDWESVHNIVQQGSELLFNIPKWTIDRTMVIPTHNADKESFTAEQAKEMLFYARQNPVVFVDISHDWNDPISKEALSQCDELWCITEPNPLYLEVQRKHHQSIFQVSNRIGEENVIVIGNKWGDGVDMDRFPEIFTKLPYIPENPKALSNNMAAFELKPKSFSSFSPLFTRLTKSLM